MGGGWHESRCAVTGMDGLRQDVRAALRLLLRAPGFAAVVVVTLALAIGATTSVFSVVRGLLLKPLPYRDPGQLVRFHGSSAQFAKGTVSLEEYRSDYEHLTKVSGVAAWGYGSGSLAGANSSEHLGFGRATSSLLPVLGVQPALGRWFTRDEEEPGNAGVAVLGHALWQRRFGGDPAVVGQTVQISGRPFRIIGVLAGELELPENFDAWRPLPFPADRLGDQNRTGRFLRVIGRLAPRATLTDLRSELEVVSARLRSALPVVYPQDSQFNIVAVLILAQLVGNVTHTLW